MKRAIEVVLGCVVLVLLGLSVWVFVMLQRSREPLHHEQQALASLWLKHAPEIEADQARWRDDPLIAAQAGDDAAPVLFRHIGLDVAPSPLPDVLNGPEWLSNLDAFDTTPFDLEWMKSLASLGYWELGGAGSPLENVPISMDEPTLRFRDLMTLAKVRLVRGLQKGDAREAAREVRELARLCLTSETILGAMVGVGITGFERGAYEEATRRGHDTAGWSPISQADHTSLKRVIGVSPTPFVLLATPPVSTVVLPVGACAGLHEGLWQAHIGRVLWSGEIADRVAGLDRQLAKSTCRLPRMRKAWAGSPPPFLADHGLLGRLPFGREVVTNQMAIDIAGNWMRGYTTPREAP